MLKVIKPAQDRFGISFLLGLLSTAAFWCLFYMLTRSSQEWATSLLGYTYNIPVSFLFSVLAFELLFSLRSAPLHLNLAYLLVWMIGLVQLLLRLGFQVVPISGHLSWLTMMLVHSWRRRLPYWFSGLVGLVLVQACYFNFVLFSQRVSGRNGLLFGLVLILLLVGLDSYSRYHLVTDKLNRKMNVTDVSFRMMTVVPNN